MEVTVCVGTFGKPTWRRLARERAIPSAQAPVIHCHADTLSEARNAALEQVETEWVCFLDADDELTPGYFQAMEKGTADVRAPMLRFMPRNKLWQPRVFNHHHDCLAECITSGEGNWIPAGTVWRTDLVKEVGGWKGWPIYEDFDLAMRVLLKGATAELIPDAVYQAWVRPDSRNRAPAQQFKNRIHREIVASNLPDSQEAA